jgi:hypothetical protein
MADLLAIPDTYVGIPCATRLGPLRLLSLNDTHVAECQDRHVQIFFNWLRAEREQKEHKRGQRRSATAGMESSVCLQHWDSGQPLKLLRPPLSNTD